SAGAVLVLVGSDEGLAKARIAPEVVEVVVPGEHAAPAETRLERLEEPAERFVLLVQERIGAREVVHRRGFAVAEVQSAPESRNGFAGPAPLDARVTEAEPGAGAAGMAAGVGIEALFGLVPCRLAGGAEPLPRVVLESVELEIFRRLQQLAVTLLAAQVVEVVIRADQMRVVETGVERFPEVLEPGRPFSLQRIRARGVVERGALAVSAGGGRLERIRGDVIAAGLQQFLPDLVKGFTAGAGVRFQTLVSGRQMLALCPAALDLLFLRAAAQLREARIRPQRIEVVVPGEIGPDVEPLVDRLPEPLERPRRVPLLRVAAGDVVRRRLDALTLVDRPPEGVDRFVVAALVVQRHAAVVPRLFPVVGFFRRL